MSREAPNGPVRFLRALRVVLVSADARFAHVTEFLLTRSGFVVAVVRRPSNLLQLVEEHEPNVVILDCGDSLAGGIRRVGALTAMYPSIGVVLVADNSEGVPSSLHVAPKWCPFKHLVETVVRAHVEARTREPIQSLSG